MMLEMAGSRFIPTVHCLHFLSIDFTKKRHMQIIKQISGPLLCILKHDPKVKFYPYHSEISIVIWR